MTRERVPRTRCDWIHTLSWTLRGQSRQSPCPGLCALGVQHASVAQVPTLPRLRTSSLVANIFLRLSCALMRWLQSSQNIGAIPRLRTSLSILSIDLWTATEENKKVPTSKREDQITMHHHCSYNNILIRLPPSKYLLLTSQYLLKLCVCAGSQIVSKLISMTTRSRSTRAGRHWSSPCPRRYSSRQQVCFEC